MKINGDNDSEDDQNDDDFEEAKWEASNSTSRDRWIEGNQG